MHTQAEQWIEFVSDNLRLKNIKMAQVMDQGGRNVNGSISKYFPKSKWIAVDISDGPGVDIVADSSVYVHPGCDIVTCTEVFEHTPKADQIIRCAYDSLVLGGSYIITTAGLNRPPHGQHGAPRPAPGEFYMNINPYWLMAKFEEAGFYRIIMDVRDDPSDVRVWATK
jgi:hypothetical protein